MLLGQRHWVESLGRILRQQGNDGRELERKPVLQSLQMLLALNGAGQLSAGTVLSPHRNFDTMESVISEHG